MVEVCLKDATGISSFKAEMQEIAQLHGLTLLDDSSAAAQSVEKTTTPEFHRKLGQPVVSMVISHGDKVIAIIGNIGLPSGQVALGFFDGSAGLDAHKFAETVVKRLQSKWRLETVPQGRGAQGMEGCTES